MALKRMREESITDKYDNRVYVMSFDSLEFGPVVNLECHAGIPAVMTPEQAYQLGYLLIGMAYWVARGPDSSVANSEPEPVREQGSDVKVSATHPSVIAKNDRGATQAR